ncbi:MAG TPA: M14 family zinc carboxypeptidase [Kofleriaceae bacterium]|nr:M14 family zinc carboxypeptidase [Kofleriaceae bacterium]
MKALLAFVVVTGSLGCRPSRVKPAPEALQTTAERTHYQRTGRYAEAIELCHSFARAYDGVRCSELGTTTEGRPIIALVIARRPGLPVIYLQAGIHAGEIEGKDAGFAFLRDLLDDKVAPGALDHVSVVFVPVMNPDGHERFSPNSRPNQRGPEEMGFRTNGLRLNLNRDFVKADAPETQAVLGLVNTYDPVVLVDLHTTDGAKFEHDLSINVMPIAPRADRLDELAGELSNKVVARLAALGHLPVDFYPSFVDDERPHSGFTRGEAPPRFSHSYMPARGRLGILVETHSWRTYRERAESTYHTLQALFEEATHSAATWRTTVDEADRADRALAGAEVTLMWKVGTEARDIDFRGYAYERRISELTGGTWLVYDETRPEIWRVPLYDHLEPATTVRAPAHGYVVEGGFAALVAPILERHGIVYERLANAPRELEVFRVTGVQFQPPYEARTRAAVTGAWTAETRTPDAGALFVPIAQPKARLLLHLFEPALPDSLAQWGLFNAVFEEKEYIEPYVMEEAARQMLAARPGLRAEYEAALAADPQLAESPAAKLDWFYRRHPAWDDRTRLIPIYRY